MTPVLRQRASQIRARCLVFAAVCAEGEEDVMARSSTQRELLIRGDGEARRLLIKREKRIGSRTEFCEQFGGLEASDVCDFENIPKRACQKEKIKPNEQSKEGGQLK